MLDIKKRKRVFRFRYVVKRKVEMKKVEKQLVKFIFFVILYRKWNEIFKFFENGNRDFSVVNIKRMFVIDEEEYGFF